MRWMVLPIVCVIAACVQGDLTARVSPPDLDRPYFDCKVQPILIKNCGTFACHGDGRRFLRLYGRNRLRLGGEETDRNAFMRPEEREANFLAARGMVDADDPAKSLLRLKPLSEAAGGYFHEGAEIYGGGDVFSDVEDPEFQVIVAWTEGATEELNCIEPGSDQ